MSQRFAVLIGVNTYAAAGQGTFTGNDLQAPRNDVATWQRRLAQLGWPDANVRVLTSPALPGGAEATTDEVAAATGWLVDQLAAAGDGATGVVFFCGHGNLRARAWASLYLADYVPGAPLEPQGIASNGVFHLGQLRMAVEARAPQATLIALIDGCREQASGALRTGPVEGLEHAFARGNQVLVTAAAIGESSYERCFQGVWRGQFTWALDTVIDQWAVAGDPDARYVAGTFGSLVARASALIGAVSASDEPQTPGLFGGERALATAAFHPVGASLGQIQGSPNEAPGHEWEAGTVGVIYNPPTTGIGTFSVSQDGTTLTTAFAGAFPASGTLLKFVVNGGGAPASLPNSYSAPTRHWEQVSGLPGNTMLLTSDGMKGLVNISNSPRKWTWYVWDDTEPKSVGSPDFTTTGTLSNQPNKTLWRCEDHFT